MKLGNLSKDTIIRITFPDGRTLAGPLGEYFFDDFSGADAAEAMQVALNTLSAEGIVKLTNPRYPGKEVRIEIVGKEQAN